MKVAMKRSPEVNARIAAARAAVRPPLSVRFWEKVDRSNPDGCWVWTSAMGWKGYGRFWHGKKIRQAHHVALELSGIEPPNRWLTGEVVDHICKNPACVNPAHLRIVLQSDNCGVLANPTPHQINKMKTHCIHGHAFTPENTYLNKRGHRNCVACLRAKGRKVLAIGTK